MGRFTLIPIGRRGDDVNEPLEEEGLGTNVDDVCVCLLEPEDTLPPEKSDELEPNGKFLVSV